MGISVVPISKPPRASTLIADADLNLGAYACIANVLQAGAIYTAIVDNASGNLVLCPTNDVDVSNALSIGAALVAAVDQMFCTVAADAATLKAGDATEHTTQSTTYVKVADVGTVPVGVLSGTLRITWDQKSNWVTSTVSCKVYRNGVAVGVEKNTTGDAEWHAQTDDVAGWTAGDTIEIWAHQNDGARTAYVKQDAIKGVETVSHKHTQLTWS